MTSTFHNDQADHRIEERIQYLHKLHWLRFAVNVFPGNASNTC